MKLATLRDGSRDGQLVVVSRDLNRAVSAHPYAATLQQALDSWSTSAPMLEELYHKLNAGSASNIFKFLPEQAMAPLPRAYQWCDASAFLSHGERMQRAFNLPPIEGVESIPLMYQGASDDFIGPLDPIVADAEHGIDFEGEFGVIVDDVPMGCPAERASGHIKLIVLLNDISLRLLAPREMKTGFGFLQAKPSTAFAAVAITPDELGDAWQSDRVTLRLEAQVNGDWFGSPCAATMHYSFSQLIAHAARTRKLGAGTVIGSGTISNEGIANGFTCISERRAADQLEQKELTPYLRYGDRVRLTALDSEASSPFGSIEQTVVARAALNNLERQPLVQAE
ncbi:fumarylacetoacetate hydrolase family protein [Pseudomonas sp. CIP-10]|uniref:fumarylacetoacetate hydrolase family protein n=1 Tax=Pseudomonas sp. CIP-10 TaxID=2892442 RepID=UPI001E62237A|nr:fumarylacetoacetate hydrolase family protein [Pseudomonas sp. CIP-10]UFH30034.1 fumarylacetoacetate hydrolase family protein [Pseudomonas sp. CIP-10]